MTNRLFDQAHEQKGHEMPSPTDASQAAEQQVSSSFQYGGRLFHFLLPSEKDHVSGVIRSEKSFYEVRLLSLFEGILGEDGLVLDVGANIGNHTVFFASVMGCRVVAFEANREAAFFLRANIRLNELDQRVVVHEVAVSDGEGRVSVDRLVDGNLGATSFKPDPDGTVAARSLDSYDFGGKVSLLKIDVEGMEALVLSGAMALIKRDRPIIVCEAATRSDLEPILEVLREEPYVIVGCVNATDTYIFAPSASGRKHDLVARLLAKGLVEAEHDVKSLVEQVRTSKKSIDKVAQQQRQLISAIYGEGGVAASAHPLAGHVDSMDRQLGVAKADIDAIGTRLDGQQAGLASSFVQLATMAQSFAEMSGRISGLADGLGRHEPLSSALSTRIESLEADVASRIERLDRVVAENRDSAVRREDLDAYAAANDGALGEVSGTLRSLETDFASRMEGADRALGNVAERLGSLEVDVLASMERVGHSLAQGVEATSRLETAFAAELSRGSGRLDALAADVARFTTTLGEQAATATASYNEIRSLRAALVKAEQDSVSRVKQARRELGLELGTLASRLEKAISDVEGMDARFNALMNGRIFSFLKSVKRAGRSVLHPFAARALRREELARHSPIDGALVRAAGGNAGQEGVVPIAAAPSPVREPVDAEAIRVEAGVGSGAVAAAVAALPVRTKAEREAPDEVAARLLRRSPAYMARKSSGSDRVFLEWELPADGLITVVMTTFNTRDYVEAAIESILRQTHRNLELIVVDDGSTDGTLELIDAIVVRDPRVSCISFGVNRGTYWCKNYGITKAKGVAITFMDSDDVSDPSRLEKQYALLREPGCAVSTCLHERRDAAGNLLTVAGRTKRLAYISQMMRKGTFDLLGYFDSVRTSADDEMLRRIKRFVGDASHRTVHEVLYHAIVRETSLTQDPSNSALSATPGVLSEPRKAYSDAVDRWHEELRKRGRRPYVPFPVVRRPFPIHERLEVAPASFEKEFISACVASFPPRERQLRLAVRSLIDQVDVIYVYLNQYAHVPDFLNHPRIVVELGGVDLRDNGKFHFVPKVPDGYCFTVDDDIIYPPDYIQGLIRKIEIYGRKAAVGLHGTIFAKPFVSYFEGRRVLHFRQSLARDQVVDQLGTGTLAFHTSLWRPSGEHFDSTGMVDAWIAAEARRRDVTLIAVERRKAWLTPIPEPEDAPPSLFQEFRQSSAKQSEIIAGCRGWGIGVGEATRDYLVQRVAVSGQAFAGQVSELEMASAQQPEQAAAPATHRELFRLAVVGRTNKERWKKGGILKSTHLTADMLRPLGIDVALVDLEMDDPRTLNGCDADIVMIYPGDPERPDFKDVLELVDHHARLGRSVVVNLSLNGRPERKRFIVGQMSHWRALYGGRVGLMTFGDRVEDDPALAPVADMIVAIPKTLSYEDATDLAFHERDGIFLGDFGKLCDGSLLAWSAEDAIEALKLSIPDAHLFCVEQYRPKQRKELGIEVLPFLKDEYTRVLARSRLMVSLVKYATFEMVPLELAAMGVPVLHPKMDNSLSDYLGLAAVEVRSVEHMADCAKALYDDPLVWGGISRAGRHVARGLGWENMSSHMYMRLLNFHRKAQS